jgi:Kef-type K+ transport system membrane component KefB
LKLTGATLALGAMMFCLPLVLRAFARWIAPHAPHSEFAFLVILAVVCAMVTRKLGVYYLVGAFVVGMAAKNLRKQLPAMASDRMVHATEAFASLFIPFYFFHAGLALRAENLGLEAWGWGLAFLAALLPLRIALVALHRLRLHEGLRSGLRVGVPLVPTLVFTLVLAEILRERCDLPPSIFGGLVIYALGTTLIPGFVMHAPPPELGRHLLRDTGDGVVSEQSELPCVDDPGGESLRSKGTESTAVRTSTGTSVS